MELVHVDILRKQMLSQSDVLALQNVGAADRHPCNIAAHISADHFFVGVEAAGTENDAAFGCVIGNFSVFIDYSYACYAQGRIVQKRNDFAFEKYRNLLGFDGVKHLFGKLCSARFQFAVNNVASVSAREDFFDDWFPFDAASVSQPLNSTS